MQTHSLFRNISFAMATTVAMFLITVVSVVFFMALKMNQRAAEDSAAMVSGFLTDVQTALSSTALDYSWWDAPYQYLLDGDLDAFYEDYAVGATDGSVFQLLAVTDGPVEGTMSWVEGGNESPAPDLVPPHIIEETRRQLALVEVNSGITHDFFGMADGELYIFSGTRIEPEDATELNVAPSDLALAVFGFRIDGEQLSVLAERYLLENVELSARPDPVRISIPVKGYSGTTLTHIVWDAPRPGDIVLRRIGVPLILVILAFLGATAAFTSIAQRNARKLVTEEARASNAARTDVLTGLPNRFALNEKLSDDEDSDASAMAVLFIDVNGFKMVNDSIGHKGGDMLICALAERIENITPKPPFVARVGGDEFSIVIKGPKAERRALDIAEQIKIDLLPEFRFMGRGFHVGVAIGLASRENNTISGIELLRRADLAMYKAKGLGISDPMLYDSSIDSTAEQRRIVEEELYNSLSMPNEFSINYQPIVAVETGEMVKAEALARWESAKIGRIDPDTFISVAEETGLMVDLGRILFLKICDDLLAWPDLQVSINISPAQLNDGTFVRDTIKTLAERDIDPNRIEIEITENLVVSNVDMAAYKLDLLHEAGFRTSLDDFGTGFSSIGYLKQLPFDTLKIDKSFASEVTDNIQDIEMLKAMVIMGHSLGKTVVCEGVETAEQVEILRKIDCDLIQGYYFSWPLEITDLKTWREKSARMNLEGERKTA